MAVVTLIGDHTLLLPTTLIRTQPAWIWLGGLFGVVYLTGNILLFPKLGSVQTVIMPVLGQILMGLLVDNFGWFGSPVNRLTVTRSCGALLVLAGVLVTVALSSWLANRGQTVTSKDGRYLWLWRFAGILTGMLSASQTAVNGHLGLVLGSSLKAALISFLIGTILLAVIVLVMRTPLQLHQPVGERNPWWMWIGGSLGALYVLGNVVLVQLVGTGLAVVIVLVGLMGGSLLIDQFGWLQAPRHPVSLVQMLGLLIMIAGVAVIRLV